MSSLWVPVGELSGTASLGSYQYARESLFSPRLDADLRWKPLQSLSEIRLIGFAEAGSGSDWNLDLDPVVYRRALGETEASHVWIGRTHPLNESDVEPSSFSVYPGIRSAIGANWVQNQASALDPRVSGWISTGIHHRFSDPGIHVTAAFSPVFLPNFGPATSLTADAPASGSRFARLPPSYVRLGEALLPLRYQVEVGDLKDIVLQNQYFLGLEQTRGKVQYALMGWSAPSPAPSIDTAAKLRTHQEDLNVLVTARPKFERENFLAARVSFFEALLKPELEAVLETRTGRVTLSSGFATELGRNTLSFGLLHTVNRPAADASSGGAESPYYADHLVWTELYTQLSPRLSGNIRLEQHLTPGKLGNWIRPELEFSPLKRVRLFANVSILTGDDYGYFGTWRSLDSVAMGARLIW